MMSAVAKYFDELKLFAESEGRDPPPKPEQAWLDFDEMKKRNTDNAAVADKEPPKLLPKVIMYDQVTGAPINAQDARAAAQEKKSPSFHGRNGTEERLRNTCAKRRPT